MAKKVKIPDAEKENTERWLLTYADMITLLMLFFIVLWSMSKTDVAKYNELSSVLSQVFSGSELGYVSAAHGTDGSRGSFLQGNAQEDPLKSRQTLRQSLETELDQRLQNMIPPEQYQITAQHDGIRIALYGNIFFKPGSADLGNEGRQALVAVAEALNALPNKVRVEGHTDNTPLDPASPFVDNWGLSSARSLTVLRILELLGIPNARLSSLSQGEAAPIWDQSKPEGLAQERRVDLVILYDTEEFQ